MLKFKYKKNLHEYKEGNKFVVYYNYTDIFLGISLMLLVSFFIHDYLSHSYNDHSYSSGSEGMPTFSHITPTYGTSSNGTQ